MPGAPHRARSPRRLLLQAQKAMFAPFELVGLIGSMRRAAHDFLKNNAQSVLAMSVDTHQTHRTFSATG